MEAAQSEAEEESLLPTGERPTVADRVSDFVDAAVDAAHDTLRGRD